MNEFCCINLRVQENLNIFILYKQIKSDPMPSFHHGENYSTSIIIVAPWSHLLVTQKSLEVSTEPDIKECPSGLRLKLTFSKKENIGMLIWYVTSCSFFLFGSTETVANVGNSSAYYSSVESTAILPQSCYLV